MSSNFLEIYSLEKSFDGIKALADFSCALGESEILGLIGPNGAGKTTFFNTITGFITPDRGKALFRGVDLISLPSYKIASIGIARTFQNLRLIRHFNVLENVLLAFRNQPGEKLRNVFFRRKFMSEKEKKNREAAILLLKEVNLGKKIQDRAEDLSYGQQKLLSLVCCLAANTDLLLLDEPVAGIAPEMADQILSIIRALPEQGKSVILIEHNLKAVMKVCNRIIFMDNGRKISEGKPTEVMNDPEVIKAYLD